MEIVVISQSSSEAYIKCYPKNCTTGSTYLVNITKCKVSTLTPLSTTRIRKEIGNRYVKLYGLTRGCIYNVKVTCQAVFSVPQQKLQLTKLEAEATFSASHPYDQKELKCLQDKAIYYMQTLQSIKYEEVKYLIRTKKEKYFEDILAPQSDGIMNVYIKDFNGDPRSPINHRLTGLFFESCTRRAKKTYLPTPFGNKCLAVKPDALITSGATRLYFADFYCMTSSCHTVSLVATEELSEADNFCQEFLIPLNMNDNPFLFIDSEGVMRVAVPTRGLFIEILYCNNVHVRSLINKGLAKMKPRQELQRHNGKMKPPSCTHCNMNEITDHVSHLSQEMDKMKIENSLMEALIERMRFDVSLTD